MLPQRIYEKFIELFPAYKDQVKSYKESGKNTIRIKFTDSSVLYFNLAHNSEGWSLTTDKEVIE